MKLGETEVREVFVVVEFESIVKIELALFLVALAPIFTKNLGEARDRFVL